MQANGVELYETFGDPGQPALLLIMGLGAPAIAWDGGERTAKAVPGARLLIIEGMGHALPPVVWDDVSGAILEHAAAPQ